MSTIAQEILDSISTLIDGTIERQENVKVIECTIEGLIDPSIGLYDVIYLKQHLKAYTNTITTQYSKDDSVYVLSQDGNLDGKLIIIGSSNPYVGLYDTTTSEIRYKKIGETIFEDINDNEEIAFCSYQSPQEQQLKVNAGSNFNVIFSHYLDNYRTFCLSMDTRTDIKDPYQKVNGDYGIIINIPFIRTTEGKTEEVVKTYYFNTEQMEGSPYDFIDAVTQTMYITFDDDLTYDSSREVTISAFCRDFSINPEITEEDIFLSRIQFYPVEAIDASAMTGYHMILTATEGNYFLNKRFRTVKEITPTLLINGIETNLNNLPCYWFVQDNSVGWGSPYYNSIGGYGWRCLNPYSVQESSDGTTTENILNTDIYSITVKQEDVVTSLKYKCVIIYNNTAVSQNILIEDLDSDVKITLSTSPSFVIRDSLVMLTCDVTALSSDLEDDSYLSYSWMRYNSAGDYIDDDFWHKNSDCRTNFLTVLDKTTGLKKYTTDVVCYGSAITDSMNLFACTVYKTNKDGRSILLGTTQVLVVLNSIGDTYLSMVNSNKLYKYDSYGNSPMTQAYDGPLSSRVAVLDPLSFILYKKNGEEYTKEEYDYCKVTWSLPKNSMMNFKISDYKKTIGITVTEDNDYYYVSKQGKFDIDYTINSYYSYSKSDNSVILSVNLTSENIVSGTADIQFVKEGENGTNGTQFSVLITYNGVGYDRKDASGIRQKLQLMYLAGNDYDKWYVKPNNTNIIDFANLEKYAFPSSGISPFNLEVYKDGILIDNLYSYSVEWSIFDENATKPFFTMTKDGKLLPATNRENKWNTISIGDNKCLVTQAKVTVTSDSAEDADTIIYAYYPIEMLRVDYELFEKMTFYPSLDGGYSIVTYDADGSNPKWDTGNNDSVFDVNTYMDFSDTDTKTFKHEWRLSDKLVMRAQTEDAAKITPAGKYDDGNANNYVAVVMYPNLSDDKTRISEEELIAEKDANDVKIKTYATPIAKNIIEYEELKNLGSTFTINESEEEKELAQELIDVNNKIEESIAKKETLKENYTTNIEAKYPDRGTDNYASEINSIIAWLKDYEENVYNKLINLFKTNNIYGKYLDDAQHFENTEYLNKLIEILKIQNPVIGSTSFNLVYNDYLNSVIEMENAETEINKYKGSINQYELMSFEHQLEQYDILTEKSSIEALVNDDGYSVALRIKGILDEIEKLDTEASDYELRYNEWFSLLDNFNIGYQEAVKNYAEYEKTVKELWKTIIDTYVVILSNLIVDYLSDYKEGYVPGSNLWKNNLTIELTDLNINTISNQVQIDYNNLSNIKNCDLGTYNTSDLVNTYNSIDDKVKAIYNNNNDIYGYKYLKNDFCGSLEYYINKYENYKADTEAYELSIEVINNGKENDEQSFENSLNYLENEKEQFEEKLKIVKAKRISEITNWLDEMTVENEYLTLRTVILDKLFSLETIINNYQELFMRMFDEDTQIKISSDYPFKIITTNAKTEIYASRYNTYGLLSTLFHAEDIPLITKLDNPTELKDIIKKCIDNTDGNTAADTIIETIDSFNYTVDETNEVINKLKALDRDKESSIQNIYSKILSFVSNKYISGTSITSETIYNQLTNLYNIPEMDILLRAKVEENILNEIEFLLNDCSEDTTSLEVLSAICNEDRNYSTWSTSLSNLLQKFYMLIDKSSITLEDYEHAWDMIPFSDRIISSVNYQNTIIKTFVNLLALYFDCIYSDNKIIINIDDISGDFIKINKFTNFGDSVDGYANKDSKDINELINITKFQQIIEARGKIIQCSESSYIVFMKPIVFRLNTNEFGWLNDWDGNKLYIDEDGEYIIAPQLGAGAKDEENNFTGITMGVKRTHNGLNSDIGLFGFSKGRQSIFLDAKSGKAQFGLAGAGQINLDPRDDTAKLYSGNFYEWNADGTPNFRKETGKGMLIDLTTPEIRFGSGGFWVDKDGNMHVGGTGGDSISANKEPTSGTPEEGYVASDENGVFYYNGYNKFYYDSTLGFYKTTIDKLGFSLSEHKVVKTDTSGYYFYTDGSNETQVWLNRDVFTKKDETGVIETIDIGPYVRETIIQTLNSKDVLEDTLCYYYYDSDDKIRYYFYDSEIDQYLFYDEDGRFWYWDEELVTKVYYEPDTNLFFYFDNGVKAYLKSKKSELGGWYVGEDRIYSENHKMTLYSAYGDETRSPAIYSGAGYTGDLSDINEKRLHNTFNSTKDGFYLGDEGLSVGSLVRASNKEFFLGDDTKDKKYFRAYMDEDTEYGKVEIGLVKGDINSREHQIDEGIIYIGNKLPTVDDMNRNPDNLYKFYRYNSREIDTSKEGNEDYKAFDKYYLYSYERVEEWTDVTTDYLIGLVDENHGLHIGDTIKFKYSNNKYDKKWELGASKKAAYFYFNTERTNDTYLKDALELEDDKDKPRKYFNIDMAMLDSTKINPKRIYLGSDGMIVSDQFKIDIGGNVELGDVKSGVSWRFNTHRNTTGDADRAFMFFTPPNEGKKSDNSAASLNATGEAANATIYIGTDGLRVGNFFEVHPSKTWGSSMGGMSFGPLSNSRHWDIITKSGELNGKPTEYPYIIGEGGDIGFNDVWSTKTNGDGGILRENRVNDKREYEPIMGRISINKKRLVITPTMIMGGDTFFLDSTPDFNGGNRVTCQIKADNFYIGIPDETNPTVDVEGKKFDRITYVLLEDYIKSIGGGGGNLPQAELYTF